MKKERLIEIIDNAIELLKTNQEAASQPALYELDDKLGLLDDKDVIDVLGEQFQKGVKTVRTIINIERNFVLPQDGAKQSTTDSLIAFLERLKTRWIVLNVICRIM